MKNFILSFLILLSISLRAQITQPTQPASGPGGSDYPFGGVTQYDYGTNGNGGDFWLYEPNSPTPDSANVVVFIHGLGETNPKLYGAFIKHLVRKGNIVIYPRYQKDLNADGATFNDSCAYGIQRALDTLQQPGHVKPRLNNYFIVGHSVGGVLTANMTMLYQQYGLPKPLTAFSIQPGAASYLLSDYSSFPADVKYLIAVATEDIVVGTGPGTTLFNQTTQVPTSHKNLITQHTDSHGAPASDATHFAPLAGDTDFDNGETNLFISLSGNGPVDGVDFYCFWKLQDALMDCALHHQNCEYAFGDTPEQHGMGNWSDGTPVTILEVTPAAQTSVTNLINEADVFIYPNPNAGNFELQISNFKSKNAVELSVVDLAGKAVFKTAMVNPKSTISLDNVGRGLYFYLLKNASNEILKTGKLVVE